MRILLVIFALFLMVGTVHAQNFETVRNDSIFIFKDRITGCYYFKKTHAETAIHRRLGPDGLTHLCDNKPKYKGRIIFSSVDEGDIDVFTDVETGCNYISGSPYQSPLMPRFTKDGDPMCVKK